MRVVGGSGELMVWRGELLDMLLVMMLGIIGGRRGGGCWEGKTLRKLGRAPTNCWGWRAFPAHQGVCVCVCVCVCVFMCVNVQA